MEYGKLVTRNIGVSQGSKSSAIRFVIYADWVVEYYAPQNERSRLPHRIIHHIPRNKAEDTPLQILQEEKGNGDGWERWRARSGKLETRNGRHQTNRKRTSATIAEKRWKARKPRDAKSRTDQRKKRTRKKTRKKGSSCIWEEANRHQEISTMQDPVLITTEEAWGSRKRGGGSGEWVAQDDIEYADDATVLMGDSIIRKCAIEGETTTS